MLVKLRLIFLVTSPFTTPSSNPFVLSFLHKFVVFLSKKCKHFLLSSLVWVFTLLWSLPHVCKYSVKSVCFSHVNLCQFNFQTQSGTLKGQVKLFPLQHFLLTSLTSLSLCALPHLLWLFWIVNKSSGFFLLDQSVPLSIHVSKWNEAQTRLLTMEM